MRTDQKKYCVAVCGATGMVGKEMVKILEQRNFPVGKLVLLASERSEGEQILYKGAPVSVQILTHDSFAGVEIALFSAGASVSIEYAPSAVKAGAVVIDNTSAFRMDKDIPLVVPEVNPHRIKNNRGIIANPNCSTIGMLVALKPLYDYARIKRIVVSTYQSVSGAGKQAVDQLLNEMAAIVNNQQIKPTHFPYQIAGNLIPHIDVFFDTGYTKEEMKMVQETKKIMEDDSIKVAATTVRVPVMVSHSESINVEFEKDISPEKARELLSRAPGVRVYDDPAALQYPMPLFVAGQDDTFVGRIRRDDTVPHGLALWIVSDNLRKGAALNAIQIAEELIRGT